MLLDKMSSKNEKGEENKQNEHAGPKAADVISSGRRQQW